VLELYRRAETSVGKAAELLAIVASFRGLAAAENHSR
jgi:hypothetical protein